ncbi:MAG TPA: RNA polymerase sigma factor [Vicinamibacterales bacterium]|nr:RNA polymerase sigma factor [Vicinamibacterales bacterium]
MAFELQSPDDRGLVEAYVRGRDEDSFLQLYRAHTPALFRMAWRLGGLPTADVEDVIQETWLRAARSLGQFRFQSTLRTWLTSVLINCMHEARRRQKDVTGNEPLEPAAPPRSTGLQVDIERAVASLPSGMREVFILFDVEGFTHEEIAGLLNIHAGTSKSQLFTARRKLRNALGSGPRPVAARKTNHG